MMMRDKNILFLTHAYTSFQKNPIEILASHFHKVYVLARYKPVAEISRILPINFLKHHRKDFVFQLQDKPENVTVIPVPLYYLPTKQGYIKLGEQHFRQALKIIQQNNITFDIIHSFFIWTAGYVGARLKEHYHKKFLITSHRNDADFFREIQSGNPQYYWAIRQADAIIRVNKHSTTSLKRYNDHVFSLPNGFISNLFYKKDKDECRKKLQLPLQRKILLTVGFLNQHKGHHYLIDSVKEIIQKEKNLLCIIVGSGEYRKKLQRQIQSLHLQEHVKLVGGKLHHEIPDWINACDLFVLPTQSEGNPTVMFEALGCGKPFIGTNVGGIPEIITSDDYGFIVEKGNVKDLTEKLLLALNKTWDEQKIWEYGQSFRWENIAQKIVELYQEI